MTTMPQLGKLLISQPFYQAALAGYSDAAMRVVARRLGCGYCSSEALLDQLLLKGGKGRQYAQLMDVDNPVAGQIIGSQPQQMARAARILVDMGYDVIDVNLACPMKKLRRKSRGGNLLQYPEQAAALLDAVREAVGDDRSCTVKLRAGFDDEPESFDKFIKIFEKTIELGYDAATVHCRTVRQIYHGRARWSILARLVEQYGCEHVRGKTTPTRKFIIGGSGDIWHVLDIVQMLRQTGVDWVSVARGAVGNPWIFANARDYLSGDWAAAWRNPTVAQQRHVLLEHFAISSRLHGQKRASRMMRKFGIRYAAKHHDAEYAKRAFVGVKSLFWQIQRRDVLRHT